MVADAFPLHNAENNADEKILHPENRNCVIWQKTAFYPWNAGEGIATRYAKTPDAFIAAGHVRCIAIWAAIRA